MGFDDECYSLGTKSSILCGWSSTKVKDLKGNSIQLGITLHSFITLFKPQIISFINTPLIM
jgi:hypothetical protein